MCTIPTFILCIHCLYSCIKQTAVTLILKHYFSSQLFDIGQFVTHIYTQTSSMYPQLYLFWWTCTQTPQLTIMQLTNLPNDLQTSQAWAIRIIGIDILYYRFRRCWRTDVWMDITIIQIKWNFQLIVIYLCFQIFISFETALEVIAILPLTSVSLLPSSAIIGANY